MLVESRNLRNYCIALVTLIGSATLYTSSARYLLRIPDVEMVTPRPPTEQPSLREDLADLFPEDAWQLGQCKRLLTGNGVLLFQDWEQISEDQWKLEPLTVVVGRGLSEDHVEAPVVLTAQNGAELQFAKSLDMMGGSAPPIKMGRMIGKVHIHRNGSGRSADALDVKTQNVWIDNQKVWTTEPIHMQVGQAEMKGRDLTIHLASSTMSATNSDSATKLLDRLELVYLEELRIPLDRQDPSKPRRIGTKSTPPSDGEVSIRCKNGLVYDFAIDELSLRDSIRMVRSIDGAVVDRFDCDTLDLVLRDPANRSLQRQGPLDWIDRIEATGQPARIDVRSNDFRITADEIQFDAIGGLLTAVGRNGVQIRRGLISANLRQLSYQYDPESPEDIGVLDVLGAGIVSIKDPELILRQLTWTQGLKLQPIGRANLDAIRNQVTESKVGLRIDGDVSFKLADDGSASAGSIEGVLKPLYFDRVVDQTESQPRFGSVAQPTAVTRRQMTLVPEVFHAMDAVSIDMPQVIAQANQLSLYFEQAADLADQMSREKNDDDQRRDSQQPRNSMAGWVNQPGESDGLHAPVSRPRPQLSGQLISAKLLVTPDGIEPKDVSIKGDVHVQHQVLSGETPLPIDLMGDSMRLLRAGTSQSSGQDYLQLGSGPESPAYLKMGDGFFRGDVIKAWPSDNVVQVAGEGELKIPSQLLQKREPAGGSELPSAAGPDNPLAGVQWASSPHCRWGGGMQFDGQIALLTGGVQIDAELVSAASPWLTRMTGDQMQIALKSAIRLMDKASLSAAEIQRISLVRSGADPVLVRAEQRSGPEETEAVHLIAADRLDFAPAGGGQIVGSGPGWYRGWMLTDGDNSILSGKAAQSQPHLGTQVLQGVHLTFRESMRGDLKNETLVFAGGVRTGVRKLQSWQDAVDVNQMDRLGVGEMTMDCNQLRFGISPGMPEPLRDIPGMPTPWEMTAEGGVVIRTNTEKRGLIEGTASRTSYESSKSWLVVDGVAGQTAFVRQTWPDGKPGFQYRSSRMAINMKTFEFQTVMHEAQINNVPTPKAD